LSGFLKNSDERAKRKKDCVKQLIEVAWRGWGRKNGRTRMNYDRQSNLSN